MKKLFTSQFALICLLVASLFVSEQLFSQTIVTLSPISKTLNIGSNYRVDAKVMVAGVDLTTDAYFTFTWYKDGTLLTGETQTYLSFTTSDISESGKYYCEVFQIMDVLTYTSDTATLTVNDGTGCVGIATITADIIKPDICETESVQLTAGAGAGYTYVWSTGSNKDTTSHLPSQLGQYSYTVTVTDANACSDVATKTINVITCSVNLPMVEIFTEGAPTTICTGGSIALTGTGMNGVSPYTYKWSPAIGISGINDISGISIAVAKPNINTTYYVTITDANNNTATNSIYIDIASPNTKLGPDILICDNASRTLTVYNNQKGTTFKWSTSTNDSLSSVSIPPSSGTYTVTVNFNGCSASDEVVVTKMSSTILDAIFTETISGTALTVNAMNTDLVTQSLLFDFGDGSFDNQKTATHTYNKSNYYNVCITVIDKASGCRADTCKNILIGTEGCKADFTDNSKSGSKTIQFANASSANMTSFYWNLGDGTSDITANPNHTYTYAGYYLVELFAFNQAGGCMDRFTRVITVGDVANDCEADFYYDIDLPTHKLKFYNASSGNSINKFKWDFGDNSTVSLQQNPVHTYTKGDYYSVCLTISNDLCSNITCKDIKAGSEQTFCQADFAYVVDPTTLAVSLTDQSKGSIDSWQWNVDGSQKFNSQNATHTYITKGFYQVSLKVQSTKSGCKSYANKLINVGDQSGKRLKCAYGYITDSTIKTKGVLPVEFKGASYGDAATIEWDFGDGSTNSSTMSPSHDYAPGTYTACMKVTDPTTGAVDSSCKEVIVTTGIEDIENNFGSVSIYPNPASQSLVVSIKPLVNSKTEEKVTITNALGQTVFTNYYRLTTNYSIDISQLQSGIYFLKLQSDNGSVVKKFIKE